VRHAVVVGAGLGGLAAAIRLARTGARVTVLEKNERPGGKMDVVREAGFTFDTGPSLLTMPFVLRDLFAAAGSALDDHLDLVPLDPLCRYVWPDGARLDASGDPAVMERRVSAFSPADAGAFSAFLEHGRRIYEAAAEPFLFTPSTSLRGLELLRASRFLPRTLRLDALRTLDAAVGAHFRHPHLRQLFNRFATYNGSSPYRAPATLAIIPYVEFGMGGWYVRGGMHAVARALESLALASGVTMRTRTAVEAVLERNGAAAGVRTSEGEEIGADSVIVNADVLYAAEHLLPARHRRPAAGVQPSLAGYVMLLGVAADLPELAHHTVLFSRDYRREFDALVGRSVPYDDPTVYLCVTSKTDPSHAPPGHSNVFVLVNAPPTGPSFDWEAEGPGYREVVLRKLERMGFGDLTRSIVYERIFTPQSFARRYNAHRGAIYGISSNSRLSAFLRPPNRSREMRGLYYAGGSAHPGGGVPLVLLSGRLAAELVAGDWGAR
jgi:phytoene desaturase